MSGNPLRAIARKWAHERHAFEVSERERATLTAAAVGLVAIGGLLYFVTRGGTESILAVVRRAAADTKKLEEKIAELETTEKTLRSEVGKLTQSKAAAEKFASDVKELSQKNEKLGVDLAAQRAELENVRAAVSQHEQLADARKREVEEMRTASNQSKVTASETQAECERLVCRLGALQQEMVNVSERAAKMDAATNDLSHEREKLEVAKRRISGIENELDMERARSKEQSQKLVTLEAAARLSDDRASRAEAANAEARTQLQVQDGNVRRIAELEAETTKLQTMLETARSQISDRAASAAELETARSRVTELEGLNVELNRRAGDLLEQQGVEKREKAELEVELVELRARAAVMDQITAVANMATEATKAAREALGGETLKAESATLRASAMEQAKAQLENALADATELLKNTQTDALNKFDEQRKLAENFTKEFLEISEELRLLKIDMGTAEADKGFYEKKAGSLEKENTRLTARVRELEGEASSAEKKGADDATKKAQLQLEDAKTAANERVQSAQDAGAAIQTILEARISSLEADLQSKADEIGKLAEAARSDAESFRKSEAARAAVGERATALDKQVTELKKQVSALTAGNKKLQGDVQTADAAARKAEAAASYEAHQARNAVQDAANARALAAAQFQGATAEIQRQSEGNVATIAVQATAAVAAADQRALAYEHGAQTAAAQAGAVVAEQQRQNAAVLAGAGDFVQTQIGNLTQYLRASLQAVNGDAGGASISTKEDPLASIREAFVATQLLTEQEATSFRDVLRDLVQQASRSVAPILQRMDEAVEAHTAIVASQSQAGSVPPRKKKRIQKTQLNEGPSTEGQRRLYSGGLQEHIRELGTEAEIKDHVAAILGVVPGDADAVWNAVHDLGDISKLEIVGKLLEARARDLGAQLKRTVMLCCGGSNDAPDVGVTNQGIQALAQWARRRISQKADEQTPRARSEGKARRLAPGPDPGSPSARRLEFSPAANGEDEGPSAQFGSGQVSAASAANADSLAALEAEHTKAQHMVIAFIMLTARVRWLEHAHQLAVAPKFGSAPRRRSYV
jgi:chromosome segregation ATPase